MLDERLRPQFEKKWEYNQRMRTLETLGEIKDTATSQKYGSLLEAHLHLDQKSDGWRMTAQEILDFKEVKADLSILFGVSAPNIAACYSNAEPRRTAGIPKEASTT
ncbi:MAG TPA: hypothetical protein VLF68_03660 [Candidatus Saccharimonadales bacterium]|nr:hypothetical protein [Candidatus Saccharimonadales bacterium]